VFNIDTKKKNVKVIYDEKEQLLYVVVFWLLFTSDCASFDEDDSLIKHIYDID
jgi:hypothetical protein